MEDMQNVLTYIITVPKILCRSKRTERKKKQINKNIIKDVTEIRENVNLYIEMFHHVNVNIDLSKSQIR